MLLLIGVTSFLTVASLVCAFGLGRQTEASKHRLQRYQARTLGELRREQGVGVSGGALQPAPRVTVVKTQVDRMAGMVSARLPSAWLHRTEDLLAKAGLSPTAASLLLTGQVVLAAGLPALLVLLSGGRVPALVLLSVGGLGWMGPSFWLKQQVTKRQHLIAKAMPDAIDLLTVSVEAGLGFDAAISRVGGQMAGPMGEELRYYLREARMGTSRREAMRHLGERSGVADLRLFASAVIQADQLGVPMGRVLRVQSEELRRRRRQRAEEAAMKAPVKMLIPLIFFIFPSIFIVLLGPAVLQIMGMFAKTGSLP